VVRKVHRARDRRVGRGPSVPAGSVAWSATVAVAGLAVAVVVTRRAVGLAVEPRALAVVAASMSAALMVALTLVCYLSWRVVVDRRALYISAACCCYTAFPLVLGAVVPSLSSSDLGDAGAAFHLAGTPAAVVFGLAARGASGQSVRGFRSLVATLTLACATVAAVVLALPVTRITGIEPGAPTPPNARFGLFVVAAAWGVVALAHAVAPRRPGARLPWAWCVTAAGIGLTYAIGALPGTWAQGAAWLTMSAALIAGLCGAVIELQRHHAMQQDHLRAGLAPATPPPPATPGIDYERAELRHDARAALLGIEAAAQGLSRHRDLLTPEQWDELSSGLVAEVHRLGSLIDGRVDTTCCFDLRDALMPVISCARADGLRVEVEVPTGVHVAGSRHGTSRALLSLLDNARVHAAGSRVSVRAVVGAHEVTLHVDDCGPGVPNTLRGSLFERGARGATSEGSGLGLHVARRLMEESGGSMAHEPRAGGGSSFVLRLPLAVRRERTASGAAARAGPQGGSRHRVSWSGLLPRSVAG
jgi:signal transduction histidine kinase